MQYFVLQLLLLLLLNHYTKSWTWEILVIDQYYWSWNYFASYQFIVIKTTNVIKLINFNEALTVKIKKYLPRVQDIVILIIREYYFCYVHQINL